MRKLLNHDEIQQIKKEIFAEADIKYVHTDECVEKQQKNQSLFAENDKRLELILQRENIKNKLLWAIATATVGTLVSTIFQLIFK